MQSNAHGNFNDTRLVVFGCGYVGAEVARQAIARGLSVTALTRNETKATQLQNEGISTVVADLSSTDWHPQINGGANFVLNCVSSGGDGLAGYRRSYVDGMNSILAWARRRGAVDTVVYTSSTSVYPQGGGAIVDETSTIGGHERADILVAAEEGLRTAPDAARRAFVLRLAGIYGPGRHHLLDQVRAGEISGFGEHRLNLAHRDDIVSAIWACFGAPRDQPGATFNVADDGATPKAEIVRWLATRLGAAEPRFTGEPLAGRRAIVPDRVIANSRLKATLGWQPRYPTFREGYENLLSR